MAYVYRDANLQDLWKEVLIGLKAVQQDMHDLLPSLCPTLAEEALRVVCILGDSPGQPQIAGEGIERSADPASPLQGV